MATGDRKEIGGRKLPAKLPQGRLLVLSSIARVCLSRMGARSAIPCGKAAVCATATNAVRQNGQRPAADRGTLAPQAEQEAGMKRRNIRFLS